MFSKKLILCSAMIGFSSISHAGSVTEKNGRFELNWSSGKVRFYGTSLSNSDKQVSWRTAEQAAWTEGLTYLESNIKPAIAQKSPSAPLKSEKPSLYKSTSSVHTTYYGDSRIKVALEAPLAVVLSETLDASKGQVLEHGSSNQLLVTVSGKATPTAVIKVVDESGAEMLSVADMAATIVKQKQLPKWVNAAEKAAEIKDNSIQISALAVSPGTLKISKKDWQPEYAALIAGGRATFVIQ